MMKKIAGACVLIFAASGATTALAEADLERGKQYFQVCVACHGANGEGNQLLNAPANGGQNIWYVMRQLRNFRAGIRGSDAKDLYGIQMRPMAMTLSDDQAVVDVAAYIGTLDVPVPPKTVEGDVEAGKKAFVTCMPCHGDNGEGAKSLNAPRLSRQHDWYIVRQLNNFKSGVRGSHAKDIYGQQMRPMAQILATDEQVNDVAAYLNTLK